MTVACCGDEDRMAETDNIARLAEKVSDELFGVFGWERHPLRNQNWACAVTERHKTHGGTHPSDVVFSYDDPYDTGRVYVTTDLKSYGRDSISKANVAGAVRRLAMATECANLSEQFERLYVPDQGRRWSSVGLLFIYNHDGDYSGDFDSLLATIDKQNFILPARRRMFVIGPYHISYLYNVAHDITTLRGAQKIPFADQCHFYYPDMVRTATRTGREAKAASLEWLTGPWQILRFSRQTLGGGMRTESYVYYRDRGKTTDEFKYLFDYFFRYQLIAPGNEIHVRAVPSATSAPDAAAIFEKAKLEYAAYSHPSAEEEFKNRLKDVTF
jgi:hypothetical protein